MVGIEEPGPQEARADEEESSLTFRVEAHERQRANDERERGGYEFPDGVARRVVRRRKALEDHATGHEHEDDDPVDGGSFGSTIGPEDRVAVIQVGFRIRHLGWNGWAGRLRWMDCLRGQPSFVSHRSMASMSRSSSTIGFVR